MTLNDIIVSALIQTGRGHDAQTMDTWRDKLTGFANDAIMDLALTVRPIRTENAAIANGRIDCNALERECIRVMSIRQCGREADFYADERSAGMVRVNADDGEAEIMYRFMPRMLTNATDEPELNEACQQLIVTYVVARERASGEVNTQRGGNIYFQLYETGKQKLRPHMGGRDAYMLKNRW